MSESYAPCRTGVHVCGIDQVRDEFVTVSNFPARAIGPARDLWKRLRDQFASGPDEPKDLVVDLMIGDDIEDDFPMSRQMLEPMARFIEGKAP